MQVFKKCKNSLARSCLLLGFLFLATYFYNLSILSTYFKLTLFFQRAIDRAQAIIDGHFIWLGADTAQGFYQAGPFFYYLLIPAKIFTDNSWYIFIYAFTICSIFVLISSLLIAKKLSIAAWIPFTLFHSSYYLITCFHRFNNSGMAAFLGLLTISITYYYCSEINGTLRKINRTKTILISLLIGLTFQLHAICFLIALLFFLSQILTSDTIEEKFKTSVVILLTWLVTISPILYSYYNFIYADSPLSIFFIEGLQLDSVVKPRNPPMPNQLLEYLYLLSSEQLLLFVFVSLVLLQQVLQRKWKSIYFFLSLLAFFNFLLFFSYMEVAHRYFIFSILFSLVLLVFYLRKIKLTYLLVLLALFNLNKTAKIIQNKKLYESRYNRQVYYNIDEVKEICELMNEKRVPFIDFRYNLFEYNGNFFNLDSLVVAKFCFNSLENEFNYGTKKYIVVPNKVLVSLGIEDIFDKFIADEFKSDILANSRRVIHDGRIFKMFEFDKIQNKRVDFLLSSSAQDMYQLDPALNFRDSPFSFLHNFNLKEYNFCNSEIFCSLYIHFRKTENYFQLHLLSRAFQLDMKLRPVQARLENLQLRYKCGGFIHSIDIANALGQYLLHPKHRNMRKFVMTPLFYNHKLKCQTPENFQLSAQLRYAIYSTLFHKEFLVDLD